MISEDKVTEIFCIADGFCKFFDIQMEKYTLEKPFGAQMSPFLYNVKSRGHGDCNPLPQFRLPLSETFLSGKSLRASVPSLSEGMSHTTDSRNLKRRWPSLCPCSSRKCCVGKCTGMSFVYCTPLRVCRSQRIVSIKCSRA